MARATFTLEKSLAQQARELGVNISAAARQGVAAAVRAARAARDRAAYERQPEKPVASWSEAETWEKVNRGEVWLAEVGRKR